MKKINLLTLAFILLLLSTFPLNRSMLNDNNTLFIIGIGLIITACLLFSSVLTSILYNNKSDYRSHGDFNILYDNRLKRNYWLLGYFGGGAIPIADADIIARDYARTYDVPYSTVVIDEIFKSRRFKGFKYIYSTEEQIADINAEVWENVYDHLTD